MRWLPWLPLLLSLWFLKTLLSVFIARSLSPRVFYIFRLGMFLAGTAKRFKNGVPYLDNFHPKKDNLTSLKEYRLTFRQRLRLPSGQKIGQKVSARSFMSR